MQHNIKTTVFEHGFCAPRGGCPSRLANDEIECMYCAQTMHRGAGVIKTAMGKVDARTCAGCQALWQEQIGPDWYTQDWHTDGLKAHIALFGDDDREHADSLDAQPREVAAPTEAPDRIDNGDGFKPAPEFTLCYRAVKHVLIAMAAAQNPAIVVRAMERDERLTTKHLEKIPAGAVGMVKMQKLLIAAGFRVRPTDSETVDEQRDERIAAAGNWLRRKIQADLQWTPKQSRGLYWLPSLKTLEKYIAEARREIERDGFITDEITCEADRLAIEDYERFLAELASEPRNHNHPLLADYFRVDAEPVVLEWILLEIGRKMPDLALAG